MSADVPDEWVEKATQEMFGHQRVPTYNGTAGQRCGGCDHLLNETDGPNSPRHVRHQAALALAAVADDIRAQERERIAVAIEKRWTFYGVVADHAVIAAAIARAEEVGK